MSWLYNTLKELFSRPPRLPVFFSRYANSESLKEYYEVERERLRQQSVVAQKFENQRLLKRIERMAENDFQLWLKFEAARKEIKEKNVGEDGYMIHEIMKKHVGDDMIKIKDPRDWGMIEIYNSEEYEKQFGNLTLDELVKKRKDEKIEQYKKQIDGN
jgi:hypothetical protein